MTLSMEKHYTTAELGKVWKVSPVTVAKMFAEVEGVMRISMPRVLSGTRKPKVSLRIPESVAARLYKEWSATPGAALIEVKPRRRRVK